MASTISEMTTRASIPLSIATRTVMNARNAISAKARKATIWRATIDSVDGDPVRGLIVVMDAVGQQPDHEQPEQEAADVREVRDPATTAEWLRRRVGQLQEEPQPKDDQRRQFDHREE